MIATMLKQKNKVEIHPLEVKLEKQYAKFLKFARKEVKKIKKWLFFYQPENKVDEMLHIIDILVVIYITIRLTSI